MTQMRSLPLCVPSLMVETDRCLMVTQCSVTMEYRWRFFHCVMSLNGEVELGYGPEKLTQAFVLQPGRPHRWGQMKDIMWEKKYLWEKILRAHWA